MQIAIVGLGRMGANIGRRLMRNGHTVVGYDASAEAVKALEGAAGAASLEDVVGKLTAAARRLGDAAVRQDHRRHDRRHWAGCCPRAMSIIDGGNTFFKDDIRRAKALREKGIDYVDVGTSGGVWGLERGYCMMIGGDKAVVDRLDPIFKTPGARRRRYPQDARTARRPIRASPKAICMPGRPARAISSRWSITASNTA